VSEKDMTVGELRAILNQPGVEDSWPVMCVLGSFNAGVVSFVVERSHADYGEEQEGVWLYTWDLDLDDAENVWDNAVIMNDDGGDG